MKIQVFFLSFHVCSNINSLFIFYNYILLCFVRLFESSKEVKKLFGFANSLDSASDMIENTMIKVHASQVIKTFDKIILSITKSSINEQDKKKLVEFIIIEKVGFVVVVVVLIVYKLSLYFI